MIFRPLAITAGAVAAIAGWYMFEVKRETALLDRELAQIAGQIREAQKQKETFQSVWDELNQLSRLRDLSQRLLPGETTQTPQNRSLAELERRLPPPQPQETRFSAFAPRPAPTEPSVAIALLEPPPRQPAVMLAARTPLPAPAATPEPAVLPEPEPVPAPPSMTSIAGPLAEALATREEEEALPLPPPAPPPALMAWAEPRTSMTSAPAPRPAPVAAPRPPRAEPLLPVAAPVAAPRPLAPAVAPAMPAARPPAITVAAAPPVAQSLLGGAGRAMLAPPVPFGSANAATLGGYSR